MKTTKTTKTTKTKSTTAPQKTAVKPAPAKALEVVPERKPSVKTAPVKTPAAPVSSPTPPARREITTDLIAARAYIIWEKQGCPHGHDLANWLLAERQLQEEIQSFTA
jgi:hypothetical protein